MNNKRRNYFIDAKFQTSFISRFCRIVLLASVAIGALMYALSMSSTTVAIENTRVVVKRTSDFILPMILFTLIWVTAVSSIFFFLTALFTSHKIAGPLYRINKDIELMGAGNLDVNFAIRDKDQLKGLAKNLGSMCTSYKSKHAELKNKCEDLRSFLKEKHYAINAEDSKEFSRKLDEISAALTFFKV